MQRKKELLIQEYIEKKFRKYYSKYAEKIQEPKSLKSREFGFILFKDKSMLRHKYFNSIYDLRNLIKRIVPSDIFNSAAYYSNPEAEMDKKGWIGSDLIFDIDADHINSKCKELHDKWYCEVCKKWNKGIAPEECPKCSNTQIRDDIWICEECLEKAKGEAFKVLNMLKEDFGIPDEEMTVNFSGNRGYHIHVTNKDLLSLNSDSRKEIVDYIMGLGLDSSLPSGIGIPEGNDGINALLHEHGNKSIGWYKRISSGVKRLVREYSKKDLENLKMSPKVIKKIIRIRESYDELRTDKGKFLSNFGKKDAAYLIETAIKIESATIDTVVTTDIHRLIRLPYTLNSKTGLKVTKVKNLSVFDPLIEAIAFDGGEEKIFVKDVPIFRLNGKQYGPYRDEEVTLPEETSIFLICRGKGIPSER